MSGRLASGEVLDTAKAGCMTRSTGVTGLDATSVHLSAAGLRYAVPPAEGPGNNGCSAPAAGSAVQKEQRKKYDIERGIAK